MRLYTVVDNDVYLNEVVLNKAINASIKPSDFPFNSPNTGLNFFLNRFLFYTNRENWNNKAILCHTTPSAFGSESLKNNNVLISFEVDEKDVMLLNAFKFTDYVSKICKITNSPVKLDNAKKEELKEYFKDIDKKVTNIENYFLSIGFVREIPSNCIKTAYVKENNQIVPLLQMSKNEIVRKVPMLYAESFANERVKYLMRVQPTNKQDCENKKLEGKVLGDKNNVF